MSLSKIYSHQISLLSVQAVAGFFFLQGLPPENFAIQDRIFLKILLKLVFITVPSFNFEFS
jgi:hypothetical protein